MGIKIFKPSIYLGNTKLSVENISKISKRVIEDKIGSKFIHVENKKKYFRNVLHCCKECF